jgi:hypothetical protein
VVDLEDAREEYFNLRARLLAKARPAKAKGESATKPAAPAKANMDLEPVLADILS